MRKTEYTILRKQIQKGSLVSPTSQNWYNSEGGLTPWSGSDYYIGPNIGDGIYNFTASVDGLYSSSVSQGYYKWNGTMWITTPISEITDNYDLPIFLECSADEMGMMTSFDGNIEQIEQLVNFSYSQTGSISGSFVKVFSTVNTDKLRTIVEQEYTIDWGDGSTNESFPITSGSNLLFLTHSYDLTFPSYSISINLNSPWSTEKISKSIMGNISNIFTGHTTQSLLGTFSGFTIPYTEMTGSIDYLNNLDYTNNTGYTSFSFMGYGKSRLGELRKYGETTFTGTTTGSFSGSAYTGYTIDNLDYFDFIDGYTMITGTTSDFTKEEVFNQMITRNEHFLGFIDDPQVYSDIFVERGKMGVMERNLRLGEIDNMDELDIYGNGYFKVRKQ